MKEEQIKTAWGAFKETPLYKNITHHHPGDGVAGSFWTCFREGAMAGSVAQLDHMDVRTITVAYEQGYGKGLQRVNKKTPYVEGSLPALAWYNGYENGFAVAEHTDVPRVVMDQLSFDVCLFLTNFEQQDATSAKELLDRIQQATKP